MASASSHIGIPGYTGTLQLIQSNEMTTSPDYHNVFKEN
jgi:hypothetical protein